MDPDSLSSQSPPQDTRAKILESAEALFAEFGYAAVGMRGLAKDLSLSKSALFHHFPTKLDLYEEVLDRVLERVELGIDASGVDEAGPLERLDAWVASVVSTLAEDMSAARLMMRTLLEREPVPGIILEANGERELMASEIRLARIIDRFRRLLEEGIEKGVFRPVSVSDAIQSTIGMIVFHFASGDFGEALLGESPFSAKAVERRREEVAEFIRRGLLR